MALLAAQSLRSWWIGLGCLLIVVVAAVLPPQGFLLPNGKPVPMCQFKEVTHLPCPGCGLTRSFVGMAHLDPELAFRFHPVGALVFPAVVVLALMLPLPKTRERAAAWIERHPFAVNAVMIALAITFTLYGIGRIAWLLLNPGLSIW